MCVLESAEGGDVDRFLNGCLFVVLIFYRVSFQLLLFFD